MDNSLDEPFPLLSLRSPGFMSMAYTEHQVDGSHYLLLGTGDGRMMQVRCNWMRKSTMVDLGRTSV